MQVSDLTPLERLILLQLRLCPSQTAHQLLIATGSKTPKYFNRTLRTLRMAGFIAVRKDDQGVGVWSLPEAVQE